MKKTSILEDLQSAENNEKENYISFEDAVKISEDKKVSLSKIYGVGTFYSMLSFKPRGKHIIRVCGGLACHLANGNKVLDKLKEVLNVNTGETTADGLFTLEESSCLGLCSVAPAMMIDDKPYGNLTEEKVAEIIKSIKEGVKK